MNSKILEFGTLYKTQIVGALAIITGVVTMMVSGGESTQMQAGWAQVLGGFYAIFMRQAVKKTQDKVEEAKQEVQKTVTATPAQGLMMRVGGSVEILLKKKDLDDLNKNTPVSVIVDGTEIRIRSQ